jgi:hypothetical protein
MHYHNNLTQRHIREKVQWKCPLQDAGVENNGMEGERNLLGELIKKGASVQQASV